MQYYSTFLANANDYICYESDYNRNQPFCLARISVKSYYAYVIRFVRSFPISFSQKF